jgi:hypothetical protein
MHPSPVTIENTLVTSPFIFLGDLGARVVRGFAGLAKPVISGHGAPSFAKEFQFVRRPSYPSHRLECRVEYKQLTGVQQLRETFADTTRDWLLAAKQRRQRPGIPPWLTNQRDEGIGPLQVIGQADVLLRYA